ncbi:arfaptin-2-like isoform X3 [Lytechinus variegatus]|uniref:arfaptin-2-like isoform X3 n=1 Tax=Lytechinus variegatus TaxID=7654 RepID=UPI001BB16287|nr:arfaptin-2-like isoform X3 [Lytechinus variegatus]
MSRENGAGYEEEDLDDTFEQDLHNMIRDGAGGIMNPLPGSTGGGASLNASQGNNRFTGVDLNSPQKGTPPPSAINVHPNPNIGTRLANPRASPIPGQKSSTDSPVESGHGYSNPMSGSNGDQTSSAMAKAKLDSFKNWSISTYKCTRQMVQEKLGKASRTVDLQLEAQIEVLRDTQRKYAHILKLTRALTNQFYLVVQTQRSLGDAFGELSQKSPELQEEFTYNAETQKSLCLNGETLLSALNFFTSSVSTLCNKTMEDTLLTVKLYESARIEYDAYRADMEHLSLAPKDAQTQARLHEARQKYETQKEKFDKLRQDVSVKLRFLDENKVKVMHKQLLLFHNAVAAYFSGNQQALQATLKQFNIKPKAPSEMQPSFLEKQ